MENALESSFVDKPFVKGFLCADNNGLLISAKGELEGASAGRFTAIFRNASLLNQEQTLPTVVIETEKRSVLIKEYDSMTVVLRCSSDN
eukprot:gene9673-13023_t